MDLTNMEDTLIVVTADHAHTMSFSGYPRRGDDILGSILISELDNLPYPTISYANGPSAEVNYTGHRHNISNDNLGETIFVDLVYCLHLFVNYLIYCLIYMFCEIRINCFTAQYTGKLVFYISKDLK